MTIADSVAIRLRNIIVEQLGIEPEEFSGSTSFVDIGLDSIDNAELILYAEDEFNIEIPDADAEKLLTVEDAVNYIQRQIGGK